LKNPVYL